MACPECFKGYLRSDKELAGVVDTIYGLPTYVSEPKSSTPVQGVIVIVPDAFGWTFTNNRLLADTYAAAGFRVYLPDFMEGVEVPIYFLSCMERFTSTSSLWDWICKPYDFFWIARGMVPFLWRNLPGTSHPRVTGFLEKLRAAPRDDDKGLKVGIAGFCWGGKHAIMLTHGKEAHLIDAVFTGHPSALALPSDIDNIRKPISFAVGTKDTWLPPRQMQEIDKTLKRIERGVENMQSEIILYEGASHGFSVRIDVNNPKQVEQSQQAEAQAVNWFKKILN